MALIVADRVQETTAITGTGTLTLLGAATGYRTFSSAIGNTNTTYYVIVDPIANVWEIGIGTVGAGTLTRDTVLINSSGTTSKISFTGNTSNVWCDYPATKAVTADFIYAPGTFQGSFSDGIVMDYTSGLGRISVGTADAVKFYNGGVGNTLLGGFSASTGVLFPDGSTQLSAGASTGKVVGLNLILGY